ncbi:neurogenic locus notch homolog protein 1 [Lingula anatina]|uniref:Neurogenic locus notch homolog protein 1 n=1 Tax=Lingula anatina TaxID=7574 RepID=A0A1S3IU18_LINAN|nr:neurogenic locus notch homolog protein 1 [Lingula anatina]|eukprot:XP_013401700.1 neurogenic locus notch homolog protein 1 [Lingula anatina]
MKSDFVSSFFVLCLYISYCYGQTNIFAGYATSEFVRKLDRRCSINLCLKRRCYNGGTCKLMKTDCSPKCECTNNFTGKHCLIPRGAGSNSILVRGRTDTGKKPREAFQLSTSLEAVPTKHSSIENCASMPCVHGVCKETRWESLNNVTVHYCRCDKLWTGINCDEFCDLPCQNGGTCELLPTTKEMICNCQLGHMGRLCDTKATIAYYKGVTRIKDPSDSKPTDDFLSPSLAKWIWFMMGVVSVTLVITALALCVAVYQKCLRRKSGRLTPQAPQDQQGI